MPLGVHDGPLGDGALRGPEKVQPFVLKVLASLHYPCIIDCIEGEQPP